MLITKITSFSLLWRDAIVSRSEICNVCYVKWRMRAHCSADLEAGSVLIISLTTASNKKRGWKWRQIDPPNLIYGLGVPAVNPRETGVSQMIQEPVCVYACVCVRSQSQGADIIAANFISALFCAQNQGCTPGWGAAAAPCSASKQDAATAGGLFEGWPPWQQTASRAAVFGRWLKTNTLHMWLV